MAARSLGDHGSSKGRATVRSSDPRWSWPDVPRLSFAARWRGRPGAAFADRLERRQLTRRLTYSLDGRALIRRDGRLRVVALDTTATGRSAARTNLARVVALCEQANVDYFLVPDPNAIVGRIGIPERGWAALIDAIGGLAAIEPAYVRVGAKTRNTFTEYSALASDPFVLRAMRAQDDVDFFVPVATSPEGIVLGDEWACRVERWRDDGDVLTATVRNPRASFVARSLATPVTVDVAGEPVRTLAPFATRHIFEPDFPVDVVYTWVDGDDPQWRTRRAAALEATGAAGERPDAGASGDARFRDGGELKYSLRSLAQYAPWVRRVFVVTDGQRPSWLNLDEPRLTVVDHRELFGTSGRLPTFNSHAIGARLHHIDGLAEHYLYLNDDVFFGSDVTPASFFEANGMSKFFTSRSGIGYTDEAHRPSHEAARHNVADLIQRDFDCTPTNIFYHSPIPQRRSVMAALEERYPDEFATTLGNQFRSGRDIEPNSWLHHYYGYLTGAAIPGDISYTYVELGRPNAEAQLRRLARTRDREVFCVNDHVDASPEQHAFAADWLAAYFPQPSPFERPC